MPDVPVEGGKAGERSSQPGFAGPQRGELLFLGRIFLIFGLLLPFRNCDFTLLKPLWQLFSHMENSLHQDVTKPGILLPLHRALTELFFVTENTVGVRGLLLLSSLAPRLLSYPLLLGSKLHLTIMWLTHGIGLLGWKDQPSWMFQGHCTGSE